MPSHSHFPSDSFLSLSLPSAFFLTFFSAFLTLSFLIILRRNDIISPVVTRKLIHSFMGPVYAILWLIFPNNNNTNDHTNNSSYSPYCAALIPLLFTLYFTLTGLQILSSPSLISAVSRTGNPQELLFGPLIYGISQIFYTIYYWKFSPIGVLSIGILAFGDGFSDLIGRKWGISNPLPWNKRKSYAGSLAFIFFGFIGSASMIRIYQYFLYFPEFQYLNLFYVVFITAIVESNAGPNWDNLQILFTTILLGWIGLV